MLDILIQNGSIIDGTGKKAYKGDIGISGGKITFRTDKESAARVINASGKIVCPGFIDFHSHGDMVLGQDFAKLCKVSQDRVIGFFVFSGSSPTVSKAFRCRKVCFCIRCITLCIKHILA